MGKNFVQTNPKTGLVSKDVARVVTLFEAQDVETELLQKALFAVGELNPYALMATNPARNGIASATFSTLTKLNKLVSADELDNDIIAGSDTTSKNTKWSNNSKSITTVLGSSPNDLSSKAKVTASGLAQILGRSGSLSTESNNTGNCYSSNCYKTSTSSTAPAGAPVTGGAEDVDLLNRSLVTKLSGESANLSGDIAGNFDEISENFDFEPGAGAEGIKVGLKKENHANVRIPGAGNSHTVSSTSQKKYDPVTYSLNQIKSNYSVNGLTDSIEANLEAAATSKFNQNSNKSAGAGSVTVTDGTDSSSFFTAIRSLSKSRVPSAQSAALGKRSAIGSRGGSGSRSRGRPGLTTTSNNAPTQQHLLNNLNPGVRSRSTFNPKSSKNQMGNIESSKASIRGRFSNLNSKAPHVDWLGNKLLYTST